MAAVVVVDDVDENSANREGPGAYMFAITRTFSNPDVTTVEPLSGQTTTTENDSCAGERPDK